MEDCGNYEIRTSFPEVAALTWVKHYNALELEATGWNSLRSPVCFLEAVHHPYVAALWEKPTKSVSHSTTLWADIPPLRCDQTRMEPGHFHTLPGEVEEILKFGGNHPWSAVFLLWILYSNQLSLCVCLSMSPYTCNIQQQHSSQLMLMRVQGRHSRFLVSCIDFYTLSPYIYI